MTLFLLTLGLTAWAQTPTQPPEAYATSVRLIDNLFLEPDTIDASRLLASAARGLSDEVPWLFLAEDDDGTLRLAHGSGKPIGSVKATTLSALPEHLFQLERMVTAGPYPLPDGIDVRLAVLEGMTNALDRYSRVLSGDGLDRFDTRLKGTLVGVGASFTWQGEALVVTRVDPEGPGERGGLRVGDQLLRIDGTSTVNMPISEVTRRVRGAEGSALSMTVQRLLPSAGGGESLQSVPLSLVRAEIVLPNVEHRVLEDQVGYIRIDHISQRTVSNLRKSLQALREAGALDHGLVLDLRGNTGGSMKEAARSADQFLTEGLLLRTVGHDGQRVQNLEAEMRAINTGDEPAIPVVILVDRRTASGSEIIAGALLEHERTALVGTSTYGKGTVQKIYTLDDDTRLKLTVARYVLDHDRRILPGGIAPDIRIGRIVLDDDALSLESPPWTDPHGVSIIEEHTSWRGEARAPDAALELSRRAVMRAGTATDRTALLAALAIEADATRAQEADQLVEAMGARDIDWTPAPEDGSFPAAKAMLVARHETPDVVLLEIDVTNTGEAPLHQALVALRCPTLSLWDDLAVPLGRIEPGATRRGVIRVPLEPGSGPRTDRVFATLHTHRRPPVEVANVPLTADAPAQPALTVTAKMMPHAPGGVPSRGPHGHPVLRAELSLLHHGPGALTGVEVYFRTPDDDRIELLDRGARHPRIAADRPERFDLTVEVAPDLTDPLPLQLIVDTERYGRLALWTFDLPQRGGPMVLEAPRVQLGRVPLTAPVGAVDLDLRIDDDRALSDSTLWVNGRKTHWFAGGGAKLRTTADVRIREGMNRITVATQDNQGLKTYVTRYIQGEDPNDATDAGTADAQ